MITKAFLLVFVLLIVGGFGYFAVSEPTISQTSVTKSMSLSDVEALNQSNASMTEGEQAE